MAFELILSSLPRAHEAANVLHYYQVQTVVKATVLPSNNAADKSD